MKKRVIFSLLIRGCAFTQTHPLPFRTNYDKSYIQITHHAFDAVDSVVINGLFTQSSERP